MKKPLYLFEFLDVSWLPESLRITMRELLETACSVKPLSYYEWATKCMTEQIEKKGIKNVVELGAGTAPLAKLLLKEKTCDHVKIHVTDLHPDAKTFESLAKMGGGRVEAHMDSVDISKIRNWPESSLLVLSAAFHHIHPSEREQVLKVLSQSAEHVMIFEPLRRSIPSAFLTFLSLPTSFALPLLEWRRPGTLRRVFWCWMVPVAGVFLVWDGIVSCMRQHTPGEWQGMLKSILKPNRKLRIGESAFFQAVSW